MYLKEKTNDILIYNEKCGCIKIKLEHDTLKTFPAKSKFVNLGTSCMLTGGEAPGKQKLNSCYILTCIEKDSPEKFEINVMPYGNLKEARERHNLIFLPNKNFIFACSGFLTNTCEYTDIYKGTWEMISPLKKNRGNASMACIDERYIYIIGGFEVTKENPKKGSYLSDIEYLDINNFGKGWTTINFVNNRGYNLGLSAPGILPVTNSIFLICGGFDGKGYRDNVYKIDCHDHEHPIAEETNAISNKSIFTHNMFCKIRKGYFNFDSEEHMHGFDFDNWSFGLLRQPGNN